jgi:hypothetical protein
MPGVTLLADVGYQGLSAQAAGAVITPRPARRRTSCRSHSPSPRHTGPNAGPIPRSESASSTASATCKTGEPCPRVPQLAMSLVTASTDCPGHRVGSRHPRGEVVNRPGNGGGCLQVDLSGSPSVASGDVSQRPATTGLSTRADVPPGPPRPAGLGSGLQEKIPAPETSRPSAVSGPGRATAR